MRFDAERRHPRVFLDRPTVDFLPVLRGVRLRTPGGRYAQADGGETLWPAICDTGGIITVIPHQFVRDIGHEPSGRTLPLRTFDGREAAYPWYHVLVGLPDLRPIGVRAIAPLDTDPDRPRQHITLGRDILSRLSLTCVSTLPWDSHTPLGPAATWSWVYDMPSSASD
ncbi:MAG: hypothetical protein ACODAJ_04125 [Planctomycetota bacterium]